MSKATLRSNVNGPEQTPANFTFWTSSLLKRYYNYYNRRYFGKTLRKDANVGWTTSENVQGDMAWTAGRSIVINADLRRWPQVAAATLLHEMCHLKRPNDHKHGREFRRELKRLVRAGAFDTPSLSVRPRKHLHFKVNCGTHYSSGETHMDQVRGKFQVQSITKHSWSPTAQSFRFSPVCDDTTEENKRFAKYTPGGSLELIVDNPPAQEFFELGKYYYLDFTKAE